MTTPEPTPIKRNSGRTGRQRMTLAEAGLRGPDALRKHVRRHGQPVGKGGEMPPPPAWLSPAQLAIWEQVLAHAPPGVLHASDHPNLVVFVGAIARYNDLACQYAEYGASDPPMRPPTDLDRVLSWCGGRTGKLDIEPHARTAWSITRLRLQ